MELSTELLANVTFREQRRGYSQDQVDEFLERVGVAVADLQERLKAAEQRADDAGAAHDQDEIMRTLVLAQRTARAAVEEANVDAAKILSEAEATASTRLQEAETEAATRVQEAETTAAARLAEAEATASARLAEAEAAATNRLTESESQASRQIADAESRAAAIQNEAETSAGAILAEAEATGADRRAAAEVRLAELEAEIERREREELAGLQARRDELHTEVEAMVQFLDDGRGRIRAELQAQLAIIDDAADSVPPWIRALAARPRPAVRADEEPATDTGPEGAEAAGDTDVDTGDGEGSPPEAESGHEAPRQALFDRAVDDPSGDLPYLPERDEESPSVRRDDAPAELDLPMSDPVLARARADLADALREAGVLLDSPGASTGPVPAVSSSAAVSGESGEGSRSDEGPSGRGSSPGGNGAGGGDLTGPVQQLEWRSVSIPDEPDDDPFLAELRRAVTDTEPLGPRDEEPSHEHHSYDDPEPRFRLRRNRG